MDDLAICEGSELTCINELCQLIVHYSLFSHYIDGAGVYCASPAM